MRRWQGTMILMFGEKASQHLFDQVMAKVTMETKDGTQLETIRRTAGRRAVETKRIRS
jgi:hypothetical protein